MTDTEIHDFVAGIKDRLLITKVIATRAVKTRNGDYFVGFSAQSNSTQEDGTHGLEDTLTPAVGFTRQEAKIAHYLLALQADVAAHEAAVAGGGLSFQACEDALKSSRANFNRLVYQTLTTETP